MRERYATPTVLTLFFLFSTIFFDLIIEEAIATLPSDPFFLQVYIAPLKPHRLDDPGNDNWRLLWKSNKKSH